MKEIVFENGYREAAVISLGFFDCVHKGHGYLIDCATKRASEIGAESLVFTFGNNPYSFFKEGEKEIFLYSERKKLLESRNINGVIRAEMNGGFAALEPEIFLEKLFGLYNIKELFCGSDYTFGRKGMGDVKLLKSAAEKNGIKVNVVDFVLSDGRKISSSDIRCYIKSGNVEQCNADLGHEYLITGKVIHNLGRGGKIGFPTANIEIFPDKLYPREAVYATEVTVDGKTYPAITNVGGKPTFGDDSFGIESYLIGCSADLYGKDITVKFFGKLREIRKFDDVGQFTAQLKADIGAAANFGRKND